MSKNNKPTASLSLDLDNEWAYLKAHGEPSWKEFPSYFDLVIPGILDLFDDLDLKITWFIVGQDAALDKNHETLEEIARRGHEIGNHSYHHEPWLQLYPREKLEAEVLSAGETIYQATGQRARGFRGPGFSWSREQFAVLFDNDYIYDASLLPTYIGVLARKYYFRMSNLGQEEKEKRRRLYGTFKDGFRPVKPYVWEEAGRRLVLELPVTTIPMFKIPFHMSYLLYLGSFSEALMLFYLNLAIRMCKLTHTAISFLLHPLDFLDSKQVPSLAFFPAMQTDREIKLERFSQVCGVLSKHFTLAPMNRLADAVLTQKGLRSAEVAKEGYYAK
jgi:hypothetical protein